jgi:hypothetical protein
MGTFDLELLRAVRIGGAHCDPGRKVAADAALAQVLVEGGKARLVRAEDAPKIAAEIRAANARVARLAAQPVAQDLSPGPWQPVPY